VFAHRLVTGRRVSGVWVPGENPAIALADLLEGTRLRAERIRARQFVIIAEPLNVAVEPDDPAAYSGTLSGHILDAESGLPLPGAHALLVDLDLGAVAGADGTFAIPRLPTGEYTVQFSYVGYRSVRLTIAVYPETPLLPPTIRLRPEPFALGGATVRPRSDPAPGAGATDIAAGPGRANGRQAAALSADAGSGDLLRALDWLPGVARGAGSGAGLALRGSDPHLVATYRDGAPVLEPLHSAGLVGPFQPEALRAVRLHRGTPPAEVQGGLAGALEIEPHDGRAETPHAVAAIGPLAIRGVVAVPLGAHSGIAAAARRSALGWPLRPWPAAPTMHAAEGALVLDPLGGPLRQDNDGSRADYSFYDAEATLSAAVTPRQRFTLGTWTAGDRLDVEGPIAATGRWQSTTASARYRALVGETFVVAGAYASRYTAEERVSESGGVGRLYSTDLLETGMRLEGDQYLSLAHTVRAGVALSRRSLAATLEAPAGASRVDERSVEGALWIQDVWRPMEDWQVEMGVRGELFGPHRRVSPRLLARWTAIAERLYGRAGVGRQTQGLLRLPDPGPAAPARVSARWLLAGRGAPPGEAWQAGAGVEWAPLLGLALSGDVYARLTDGTPEPRPDAAGAGDAVDSLAIATLYAPGRGRGVGVEIAARAEGGAWAVGATYSLAAAQTREPPPIGSDAHGSWRRARYDRPHSLGLVLQHDARRWNAAVRVDASSRPPGVSAVVMPLLRVELTAGYRFVAAGARWDLRVSAQPTAARSSPPVTPATSSASDVAPLAYSADGATLPAWPVFSLRASW